MGTVNLPTNSGPPPRVWGIRAVRRNLNLDLRSTPTRVGNTSALHGSSAIAQVHPHACGEYMAPDSKNCHVNGPLPRVWGIRINVQVEFPGPRSTPTRVGNTSSPWKTIPPPSVHPHACGEYRNGLRFLVIYHGPPPRVWGIRHRPLDPGIAPRSTPTRVGNTGPPQNGHGSNSVHPHACGEYDIVHLTRVLHHGPPPRVWGIPTRPGREPGPFRSTPTRVGNT